VLMRIFYNKSFRIFTTIFRIAGVIVAFFSAFSSIAEEQIDSQDSSNKLPNKICFQIDQIEILQNQILPLRDVEALQSKYQTRCLRAKDISDLKRIITNKLVEYGYVTSRVVIPEQNLQTQKLLIKIIEGRVEATEYKSGRRIKQDHVLPISEDKILNLRDIEQSSDQFSSLISGHKSKIFLKPGKKENTSIIVIDDKELKVWKLSTGIDNYGSKNKGMEQSITSIGVENLLKSNDRYFLSHRQSLGDIRRRYTRIYSGGISVPYSYHNVNFNVSHSTYRSFIHANNEKFKNSGSGRTYNIGISSIIHRDRLSKTSTNILYEHDNFSNYIADNRLEISSYIIDKFAAGVNHQRRLAGSVLGIGISYVYGINYHYLKNFGSFAKPHNKFHKVNYNLSWLKVMQMKPAYFAPKFTSSLSGQFTSQRLAGSEKVTIGGISSIRGYKEQVENSDNGLYVRNELALGFIHKDKTTNQILEDTELFVGIDVGRFANYDTKKEVKGMMSGVAFGIRNNKGLVRFEAMIGKGIKAKYIKPKGSEFYFSIGIDI